VVPPQRIQNRDASDGIFVLYHTRKARGYHFFLKREYNSISAIFSMTAVAMGIAITHRFFDISMPKYWQAKMTTNVTATPMNPHPIAR
jgi:hypothetical protein